MGLGVEGTLRWWGQAPLTAKVKKIASFFGAGGLLKDLERCGQYIYTILYIYIYSICCSCWETWKLSRNKFRNKALSSQHITNQCKQTGHWELGNVGSESKVNEQKHIRVSILDILWKGHMHSHYMPCKSHVLVMDAMLLSSWRIVLLIIWAMALNRRADRDWHCLFFKHP